MEIKKYCIHLHLIFTLSQASKEYQYNQDSVIAPKEFDPFEKR